MELPDGTERLCIAEDYTHPRGRFNRYRDKSRTLHDQGELLRKRARAARKKIAPIMLTAA